MNPSSSRNLLVVDEHDQRTPVETNFPELHQWKVKKKRSPIKTEEKKDKTNQVFEGIVNEIKSFAKDKKEEQKFMEVADFVYLIRSAKTIPQEAITEIKRKYGKADDVEKRRKELHNNSTSEPSSSKGVGFMNSSTRNLNSGKTNCPLIKRKIDKEKGKRVAHQKKIPHEVLVKEAEKREPNPPLEVVWKMIRTSGSNLKFLMEKILLETDMSDYHNRLSMPKLQVAREFLNEEEIEEIKNTKFIDVQVIHPCDLVSTSLKLSIWKSNSEVYILRSSWRDIAKRKENGLATGIKVEIWCFRNENNQLCFQIVKV